MGIVLWAIEIFGDGAAARNIILACLSGITSSGDSPCLQGLTSSTYESNYKSNMGSDNLVYKTTIGSCYVHHSQLRSELPLGINGVFF